ncbi:MAG: hypothetical protein AAF587_37600 [Bacteroidota bacterium]
MASQNRPWNLESFLDSLIVELDKARETLAVKAINKPLTYAVKDVKLELQLFPNFDGRMVQFITAEPGQEGASRISIQLGSITDQQIRKTTKKPITKQDLAIEVIEEIDDDTKDSLRKIGVSSITDLEEIEKKNVDLEKASNRKVNYSKLSGLLKKARRSSLPPNIYRASLSEEEPQPILRISGENLSLDDQFEPVAVINGQLANVLSFGKSSLEIELNKAHLGPSNNELIMILDPYALFKVNVSPVT